MSDLADGGFISSEARRVIVGFDGVDCVFPWPQAYGAIKPTFDFTRPLPPSLTHPEPFDAQDKIQEWIAELHRRQAEAQAELPSPPDGMQWVIEQCLPEYDFREGLEGNDYKTIVTSRFVLRTIPMPEDE